MNGALASLADLLLEHANGVVTWPQDEIKPAPLAPAERGRVESLATAADVAIEELAAQSKGLTAVLRAAAGGPAASPADFAAVGLLALAVGRLSDACRIVQSNAGARLTLADLSR